MSSQNENNVKKHGLVPFFKHFFDWIDNFKMNNTAGQFSVRLDPKKPSLYGVCDMVFNLTISNQLKNYLSSYEKETVEEWITHIQSYQNPKTGWFKEGLFNYGYHFKEHSTAFAISALKVLGGVPRYGLKISKKLNSQKKVEKWLKKSPEWGLLFWPGSHRGGGLGAIYATLGRDYYPHEKFFDWYFDWLDKKADREVGFWRIGWIHKLRKYRLTKHELGGSIHYYWIYEFLKRPIPYPEKVIDSTLQLQNNIGLWDKDVSYCIDLDALFCLTRCCKQTKGYRKEAIKNAIIKYLNYTISTLNDKDFLFNQYLNTHKLTGCLEAIAEVQKFYPELLDLSPSFIQTLDITPWI